MKKILLTVVAVLAVLFVGSFGYLYLSLNTLVKNAVETVGPKITRTNVDLGSAVLSPFSGSGNLHGLVIENPEGFSKSNALKVANIEINADRKTLLSETIVIDSITVRGAELFLEGTITGSNLGRLMANIRGYNSSGKKEKATGPTSRKFIVRRVLVTGSRLNISASALKQNVGQTVLVSDIRLENIGSDGSGISAADLSQQILVPLIADSLKQAVVTITKTGIDTIKNQGVQELNRAVKGISDFFKGSQ